MGPMVYGTTIAFQRVESVPPEHSARPSGAVQC
jgi:hypothetical protein